VYGHDITERAPAESALRRSETILRAVTETTPDLVFMKDVEGKVMMANPAALRAIGGTASQVIGKRDHEFHEDPVIAQSIIENDRRIMLSGQIEEVEETIMTPAGGRVFLSSKAPYRDAEGRIAGLIGVSRDITERKKQEEELRRLNRTLRALSNANQAMIHAENEADLLNEVCRIVVEDCGHAMVWIGFAEEDEGKIVRPVAQAGFEEGYLETLQVTWADTERGRGPTGTAIRSGIVNVCKNMATDPRMHPWREQAIKRGYASSIALPMKAENQVYGALTIYARNQGSFSEDEVKLLVELADDLTYGIIAIRLRLAHQQAEATLRNSETRFRLLSETASVLLASEDPQRVVNELCRKVMEHLDCHAFFNFLADEQVGRLHLNAWAGIPEEEAKKIEWLDYGVAVCGCAAQQGCRIVAENILTTPDLRTELVKSYGIQAYACHPLMAQGRVRGTLSFGARTRTRFSPQDLALMETVTTQVATAMERIRLIGDLKTSRDELEIRVQERTAELRKMNEALKQSNRDLEDFAYVASHDLQEPLRKIQTFADWLVAEQQESLNEKVRDYLERMRRAAGRMQALVQDLLHYSRLTSKPEPFTRFSLREPVEEAISDLEVLHEETEGHTEVEGLPDIEADRVQMRQLFQNLISNGLKYHGDQKPVVKVYNHSSSSPGFWEIHVKDNGIGFDEGYLDKIFKPFQRLHGRSAPYQGTGIGLAICRRIVERHGGSITAESKPGEGATFIVQLPKKRLTSEMKH